MSSNAYRRIYRPKNRQNQDDEKKIDITQTRESENALPVLQKIENKSKRRQIRKFRKGGVKLLTKQFNSKRLNNATFSYLSMLVNPFGSRFGAKIPDGYGGPTAVFLDSIGKGTYNLGGSTTFLGGNATTMTPGTAIGFLFFLAPGYANHDYYNYSVSNIFSTGVPCNFYRLCCAVVGENGFAAGVADNQLYYNVIPTSNYTTIWNTTTPNLSLCNGGRLVSAGFRIKNTIGDTTTTDQQTIKCITASNMQFTQLMNSVYATQSQTVRDLLNTGNEVNKYTNEQGVTVRLDTSQPNIINMKTTATWSSSQNQIDTCLIPAVFVEFRNTFTGTINVNNAEQTLFGLQTMTIEAMFWLETVVRIPSPIFVSKAPTDADFDKVIQTLRSSGSKIYKTNTRAHTFDDFGAKIGEYLEHAANYFGHATRITHEVTKHYNNFINDIKL